MQQKEYPQVYELGLGSLIGDFFQNVKDTVTGVAKAVAPIAPYVLPFTGLGIPTQLALGAGINLASGQKPSEVAKNLAIQTALTGVTGGFSKGATKTPIDTGAVVPPSQAANEAYRKELLGFFDEKVPGIVKSPGIEQVVPKQSFFETAVDTTKDFFTGDGLGARLNPLSKASKFKLNPAYSGMDQALIDKIIENPFDPQYANFVAKFGMPMQERGIAGQIGPSFLAASTALPFVLPQPEVDDTDYLQQARDEFQIRYSAEGGEMTGGVANNGQRIEHPDGKVKEHPRRIGEIAGPGTGTSDDIPAMLSDGEFVMTAQAVRNAGGGSRKVGAKNMYKLMKNLEKGGSLSEQSLGMVGRV